jgi:hypothetical protein
MSDEMDNNESDLETENLSDLEDEFYQRKKDPVPEPFLPQWAHPSSVSSHESFPWLSSALRSSIFATLVS